jgi:hypothetical protein
MEPASLGVILDSTILIEAERQHFDVAYFLKYLASRIGEREAALVSGRPEGYCGCLSHNR